MFTGKKISGKVAQKLVQKGALLFDTRSPVLFRDGTITGATNLSLRQVSAVGKHKRNTKIILFGVSDVDIVVQQTANYLIQMGFTEVHELGSMDNWYK